MSEAAETFKIRLYHNQREAAFIIDLKEYLIGAVAAAMPPEFPPEALKAQAICCRTNAIKHMGLFGGTGCRLHQGFDMCTDLHHCQGYWDPEERQKQWGNMSDEYHTKVAQAVEDTGDTVLMYNDNIIHAVFHCACGGCTEDSENVWGNKVSYLRRVECIYCKDSPYWSTSKLFSIRELKRRLSINFDDNNSLNREIPGLFDQVVTTGAGRIKRMKIGDMTFSGEDVKNLLGLPSTKLSWRISGICLRTLGQGHGLGLCQYGARGMAMLGFPVDEILKFYYTGVDLRDMEKPTSSKPLVGKTIVVDPGHGGASGSLGPMGLSEGYVNLEIAKLAVEELMYKGAKVYITREKNEFVSLSERVKFSNDRKPDITISIHQNVFGDPTMGGTETFYYPGDAEGKEISEHLHRQLLSALMLKDQGVREADLYILRETNSPAALVNIAFLSNPEEERLLSEPEFRQRAAKAIIHGILAYYQG
jgi:stage II sporulation protein D